MSRDQRVKYYHFITGQLNQRKYRISVLCLIILQLKSYQYLGRDKYIKM